MFACIGDVLLLKRIRDLQQTQSRRGRPGVGGELLGGNICELLGKANLKAPFTKTEETKGS